MARVTNIHRALHSLQYDIQHAIEQGYSDNELVEFTLRRATSLYRRHRYEEITNKKHCDLPPCEALHDTTTLHEQTPHRQRITRPHQTRPHHGHPENH